MKIRSILIFATLLVVLGWLISWNAQGLCGLATEEEIARLNRQILVGRIMMALGGLSFFLALYLTIKRKI